MAAMLSVIRANTSPDTGLCSHRRLRAVRQAPLPGRPARTVLLAWVEVDRLELGLTEDDYADLHGVSQRTLRRFRQGVSALPKPLHAALLARHPKWERLLDKVILEDRRRGVGAAAAAS